MTEDKKAVEVDIAWNAWVNKKEFPVSLVFCGNNADLRLIWGSFSLSKLPDSDIMPASVSAAQDIAADLKRLESEGITFSLKDKPIAAAALAQEIENQRAAVLQAASSNTMERGA